jgi:hypothetical protein
MQIKLSLILGILVLAVFNVDAATAKKKFKNRDEAIEAFRKNVTICTGQSNSPSSLPCVTCFDSCTYQKLNCPTDDGEKWGDCNDVCKPRSTQP